MSNWNHVRSVAASFVLAIFIAGCGDIHSRADFSTAVQSKTEDEVTKQFGKPTTVDAKDPNRVVWTYASKTFDTENQNKRDAKTLVIFGPGDAGGKLKAIAVDFQ